MIRFQFLPTLLACSLLALSAPALAHGDTHAAKNLVAKKEQKPWGIAGAAKSVTRTVRISMTDTMRFTSDRIEVRQGETLRLVMQNNGKLLHELVLGTKNVLDEHAA